MPSRRPGACRISGRATSGGTALPGVSMVVRSGDVVKTATSSDTDGTYRLSLPAGVYRVTRSSPASRRLRASSRSGASPCDQTVDFPVVARAARASRGDRRTRARHDAACPRRAAGPSRPRESRRPPGAHRFETLTVQTQAAAAAASQRRAR